VFLSVVYFWLSATLVKILSGGEQKSGKGATDD